MEEQTTQQPTEQTAPAPAQEKKRPGLLSVMCILTYIGRGLNIIVWILAIIAFGAIESMLGGIPGMGGLVSAGIGYFVGALILSIIAFIGAIMMWKMKKMGFYLWILANVIEFILPFILISGYPFNIVGLIILIVFIILYGINLKNME